MQLKTKGKPHNIFYPVVGRVTKDHTANAEILLIEGEIPTDAITRFSLVLTTLDIDKAIDKPSVYAIPGFEHLSEGDIVLVNTSGMINTLYRVNSNHNFLLFTERCNSNCLMCSQPPKNRDDTSYFFDTYKQLIPLIPKNCFELGITGGEPTLLGERFFQLLELLASNLPETEIHCLTNGRTFAWPHITNRLGELSYNRLMLGIPIYSDYYQLHDYVVQAKGAFDQTIQGLYNLAKNNIRVELRIVLHKQTIPRLAQLAKFIYKNLPFAEHITFMGLEYQGYTPHNIDKLWIDPVDYSDILSEAINYLSDYGMNVSIYNSQLCTTPKNIWQFARKSISDWKNIYLDECNKCAVLNECGGLFQSNAAKHSAYIKAIMQE
ncbi:His-Xaa-Ser system radical SAM maturase HxsC [Chitinophaga rupis]|uniref:His-Xaa-Ser system radical SAM maturase HxsC n=1 Tax=Chitinophaga rupis TaxID=573321 RepID=A0A1H8EXW7_9BACT|nr:His-Xaa-Ser system radical SAM maturase HxsC [Chitinophaga rupis]SEN24332.1 His-Xaa-Ser system radical SAM maturase HxsC [Chitinophaga rupis]